MNRLVLILASIAAAIVTVLAIFFQGKSEGKKQEQSDQLKEKVENGLEIKKDVESVRSASADDVDGMLRKDCRD